MTFKFISTDQPFFSNISLTLEEKKVYVVEGKNGVGKSTFFSLLQGTNSPNSEITGSVTYDSAAHKITHNHLPHEVISQVKTVVQDTAKMIVPVMTVQENLQLAQLSHYPTLRPLAHHASIPEIMKDFTLDLSSSVEHLSGGQKQILAIIMALQKPTKILLLDEPTAALDDKNTQLVINFLTTLAQKLNLIIVIITHDKDIINKCGSGQRILIKNTENQIRMIEQY